MQASWTIMGCQAIGAHLGGLLLHGLAEDLTNAFVIEKHWDAPASNKHRHTNPKNQSLGMIHLKAMSANQLHGELFERRSPLECPQCSIEVIRCHAEFIPRRSSFA